MPGCGSEIKTPSGSIRITTLTHALLSNHPKELLALFLTARDKHTAAGRCPRLPAGTALPGGRRIPSSVLGGGTPLTPCPGGAGQRPIHPESAAERNCGLNNGKLPAALGWCQLLAETGRR